MKSSLEANKLQSHPNLNNLIKKHKNNLQSLQVYLMHQKLPYSPWHKRNHHNKNCLNYQELKMDRNKIKQRKNRQLLKENLIKRLKQNKLQNKINLCSQFQNHHKPKFKRNLNLQSITHFWLQLKPRTLPYCKNLSTQKKTMQACLNQ